MFSKKVSAIISVNGRNVLMCVSMLALSVLLSSCMGPAAVDPIVEARVGIESADSGRSFSQIQRLHEHRISSSEFVPIM